MPVHPSTNNPVINDVPALRRSQARQPLELVAHDARDPQAIQRAMMIQLERDRIRSEEVAPLEERLKKLEANQLELTTRLAGLPGSSSEPPPQPAEDDLYDA
jgi:hypothetical protein